MKWTIPNLLSLFRIIAAPFLVLSAWLQMPILFFILFGAMLLSDAIDGLLARLLNQTTPLGARLDSYGDALTYLATLLSVWWLWPELIKAEFYYIITALAFSFIQALVSVMKFGKVASYHTWITKLSAILMSLGVVVLVVFKDSTLFHIAVYFLAIEMVENITITLFLKEQRTDIHSLWHALKVRK